MKRAEEKYQDESEHVDVDFNFLDVIDFLHFLYQEFLNKKIVTGETGDTAVTLSSEDLTGLAKIETDLVEMETGPE